MGFAAEIYAEEERAARAAERKTLRLRSGFRRRGDHRTNADILDLSTDGFRVETPITLTVGTYVWLSIPGMESKPAEVVWVDGNLAGCKFETPLHSVVLERIVAMNGGGA